MNLEKIIKELEKRQKEEIIAVKHNYKTIKKIVNLYMNSMKKGGKVLIFGNGGSASQASHLTAELCGRFEKKRRGLPAISLSSDTSSITAISNDYGFENLFKRQIEALGRKNDLAIAISTSGNSPNIIKALKKAKEMKIMTVSLLGGDGGKAAGISDMEIKFPAKRTSRIQEFHLLVIHIFCELIDEIMEEQ